MAKKSVDLTQPKYLQRFLNKAGKEYARKISAKVLNEVAEDTFNASKKNLKNSMTIRNKWTEKGISMMKAKPNWKIASQNSIVGSRDLYMKRQEYGEKKPASKGMGHRIPTARGSNEGDYARPKLKLSRGPNKPGNIDFIEAPSGIKEPRRRRGALARLLNLNRKKRGWLRLNRNKWGIVRAMGPKKKFKIKTIQVYHHENYTTPETRWLRNPSDKAIKKKDRLFEAAMDDTLPDKLKG